jgi:fumarate reductase subunit D
MKKALYLLFGIALALPQFAQAAATDGIFRILDGSNDLINRLLPFVITLTVLVFLWGVFKFVIAGADGDQRKEAQGYMIWGIIALFVMVSVWGLVNILVRTFDLNPLAPPAPQLPMPGGRYNPAQ